jgi:hypothetical protein
MPKKIRTRINAVEEQSPPVVVQAGLLCPAPLGWYLTYALTKLTLHQAPNTTLVINPRKLTAIVEGYFFMTSIVNCNICVENGIRFRQEMKKKVYITAKMRKVIAAE